MTEIQIEFRSVYGKTLAYPISKPAKLLANIAGTKTLTRYALLQVLDMGLTIVETRNGVACASYCARSANTMPACI